MAITYSFDNSDSSEKYSLYRNAVFLHSSTITAGSVVYTNRFPSGKQKILFGAAPGDGIDTLQSTSGKLKHAMFYNKSLSKEEIMHI